MALFRIAESILKDEARYPALEAVLKGERPRIPGLVAAEPIHTIDLDEMKHRALGHDSSYLFIQGPPGAGKTWAGARLIAHLIKNGKRVGVAAQSHKAIHNLLNEIEKFCRDSSLTFRGLKKSSGDNPESVYEDDFITSEEQFAPFIEKAKRIELVAGTAWLFSRHELDRSLDYLVIDEAGQVALADAFAMGTAARNLNLLGDPVQLAQVSQGLHPAGSGASVLEHLLGEALTIREDRGIFLEKSYRMHPDVCAFISEIVYAGRLHSDESAARRTTSWGTGIRFVAVEHDGNRTAADEEVAEIGKLIAELRHGTFTGCDGSARQLRADDFMVVAPYNAQVRRLRGGLPAGVRVGTVDKFQGQQAPVVFFSMAMSSGEDVPRNLAFLFSATPQRCDRARPVLAYLIFSPRLLEARCKIEEMELFNALYRLAEYAGRKST
jgi:uncharacterized protein